MADGITEHDDPLALVDDPGSMAAKLARMNADEAPPEKKEDDQEAAQREAEAEAARQAEEEARKAEEGKSPEELEAEASAKAADEAAKESAGKDESPEPPKRKFETLEDYDKALKSAETRMHTATTESAQERKAREALVAEKLALEEELNTLKAEKEEQAARESAAAARPKLKEKYAQALKKIKSISLVRNPETGEMEYPDDYDDQVADAWAETGLNPDEVAREAAKIAREELRREQEAEHAKTAEQREQDRQAQLRTDAERMAREQGLDMRPDTADHDLFYVQVRKLAADPKHEFYEKPLEDQVKWAANEVKRKLNRKIEMTDAEREAARRHQDNNAVLEAGVTRRDPVEKPRQRSMNEILTGNAL